MPPKGIAIMRLLPTLLCSIIMFGRAGLAADPAPVKAPKNAKVALLTKETSNSAKALLDLAQVELSNDKSMALLDRQSIDRVLAEQKLNLSGLVDANMAVQVGKLLGVDLFAIVEPGGKNGDALGIIVYDAVSGIKYVDQTISEQDLPQQVKDVAAATRTAVAKRAQGIAKLKTLCLQSVRNAELPRDRDTTCRSLGMILERRLLGSTSVGILERRRLEHLNKEKALPVARDSTELLTAVLVLDLEFGRPRLGAGLRATAIVSDGRGKPLHRASVEGADRNGGDVIEPLLQELLKYLRVAAAPQPVKPEQESARFFHEGEKAWSHKERLPAIEAMEAAVALNSRDVEARAKLALYLSDYGYKVLNPKEGYTSFGGRGNQLRVATADLKTALLLATRAVNLYTEAHQHITEATLQAVGGCDNRHFQVLWPPFLNNLLYVDERDFDDEAKVLREEFLNARVNLIHAQAKSWERLVRKEPIRFGQYCQRLDQHLIHLSLDASATSLRIKTAVAKHWLELSALPGVTLALPNLKSLLEGMFPGQPAFADLHRQLAQRSNPVLQLYGRIALLQIEGEQKKFGPAEYGPAFQQFKQAAQRAILEAENAFKPAERKLVQEAIYEIWHDALFFIRWERGQQQQELFELCDFMLDRQHTVRAVLPRVVQTWTGVGLADPDAEKRLRLIERALAVLDRPEHRLDVEKTVLRNELQQRQAEILRSNPKLANGKSASGPTPWREARSLFQIADYPDLVVLRKPLLADGFVYFPVLGLRDQKAFVQLVRVALPDGKPVRLGQAPLAYTERFRGSLGHDAVVTDVRVAKDAVLVATASSGILAFDRQGQAPARSITAKLGLPSESVQALAVYDGKIFAGLADGYLVEIDPNVGKFRMLASSRRKENLSPFDDGEQFHAPFIIADQERKRLLFLLYQRPQFIYYPPNHAFPREPTNGLWEYRPDSGRFTKHIDLYWGSLDAGAAMADGRLLLSCRTSALAFDPKTDRSEFLWASYPAGPRLAREAARNKDWFYPMGTPRLMLNGWLWTSSTFGRVALDQNRQEVYADAFQKKDAAAPGASETLLQVAPDQLIAADRDGLWLLHLKKASKESIVPKP
jgi:hypothetical protein